MKPTTSAMSAESAKVILNRLGDLRIAETSGSGTFSGKTIVLPDGSKATKLFVRNAASRKFLRVVAPQKLKQEKALAFDAISQAVKTRFPRVDGNQVMASLGIRSGESIKLSKLRDFNQTLTQFKTAANAKDIHAGSSASKNRFHQWRLQSTPGLVAITRLSTDDLMKIGKGGGPGKATNLMSFQKFVEASLDPTIRKDGSSVNEQQAILNFVADWCQMNENDKQSLKSSLSPNGQQAFDAISSLVNKMVYVEKLPVNQTGSFGLDRLFARSKKFQDERNHIKNAITGHLKDASEASIKTSLQNSARILGASLGEKWRNAGQQPRNYMGLESQSKAAIRSFLDLNMPLVLKEIPDSQKSEASAQWLLNKEAFISTMANTAAEAFIGNKTGDITNNQITIGDHAYDIGQKLNDGAEGIVRLAETTTGEKIAVKSALPWSTDPSGLTTEIDRHLLASSVNNKNILAFQGAFRGEDGGLNMAMEYAPHGDLQSFFKTNNAEQRKAFVALDPMNEAKLQRLDRYVASSIFSGLRALHEDAQMVHGDLKPGNVFICSDGVPKLADFGKSVLLEANILSGISVDRTSQLAPEVAANTVGYFELNSASDIWSAGILLYEMLTGQTFPIPLQDKENPSFNNFVLSGLTRFTSNPAMSDTQARKAALKLDNLQDQEMADLLVKIFHPDPQQRPTAREALAELDKMAGSTKKDDSEAAKLLVSLSK